jgi:D-alanyl-D-alanine carboxypeptidase/D-alanyl-D-alanine-endopeptidase (penicillin-binding protein 4)
MVVPPIHAPLISMKKFWLLLFLLCTVPMRNVSAQLTPNILKLRADLDKIIADDKDFKDAFVGVSVRSLATGDVLYDFNAGKKFTPASNEKLFTTWALMSQLSGSMRLTTKLYAKGSLDTTRKELQGDLIILGSGDPTISTTTIEAWADSLALLGVRSITGNLVADASLFVGTPYPEAWQADDMLYYYAAPASALSLNGNCVEVTVTPSDSVGDWAKVSYLPVTSAVTLTNQVVTDWAGKKPALVFERKLGLPQITISGYIPKGNKPNVEFMTVSDPVTYFLTVLKEVLERKGIRVLGGSRKKAATEAIAYDSLNVLIATTSPTLYEMLLRTNKQSDNFYAEQLIRILGKEVFGTASLDNGVAAVKQSLKSLGDVVETQRIADASGLSRLNLTSPEILTALLKKIYDSNLYDAFLKTLPIAGVDGTLATRMKGTLAASNLRAKTGYMSGARSLSGYVKTRDDEVIAVSVMIMNYTASNRAAAALQDEIIRTIAAFSRRKKS